MASAGQDLGKTSLDAFVEKQTHSRQLKSAVNDLLVGKIVGGEGLGRPDVVHGQARVVRDDVIGCHPGAQLAQNEFNR